VRWRYTTTGGRSFVAETTAWYDGLGYEYTFVDGAPFRESKGRIRLQEIAEGTVVQWTLTYETNGVLAGFRNAVGLKRQFEGAMVDSLKNLWKVLQKVMPEDKPREVKSLMRDAPDYESRTQYRPRHAKPESAEPVTQPSGVSEIVEPPIVADDTRPRAPVKVESASAEPVVENTSNFKRPVDDPDTGMIEPVVYPIPAEKQPEAKDFVPRPQEEKSVDSDAVPAARRATQEIKPVVPAPLATAESATVKADKPIEVEPPAPPKSEPETVSAAFDTVKMATGEMSVFELFGLPRPSQTQEMEHVVITELVEESTESTAAPIITVKPPRVGLRLILRRKRVMIRRPI
jgi:hypothetical protein